MDGPQTDARIARIGFQDGHTVPQFLSGWHRGGRCSQDPGSGGGKSLRCIPNLAGSRRNLTGRCTEILGAYIEVFKLLGRVFGCLFRLDQLTLDCVILTLIDFSPREFLVYIFDSLFQFFGPLAGGIQLGSKRIILCRRDIPRFQLLLHAFRVCLQAPHSRAYRVQLLL